MKTAMAMKITIMMMMMMMTTMMMTTFPIFPMIIKDNVYDNDDNAHISDDGAVDDDT